MGTEYRILADRHTSTAIRFLSRLAAGNGGYTLCGVTGWAHRRDVADAARLRLDGELPLLHAAGLANRVNAGVATKGREEWLYRITDAGARAVAERWGELYESVQPPGEVEPDHGIYIAPGPRNALLVLRLAFEREGPERFREHGWRTGRELTSLIDELNRHRAADHFRTIDWMDLKWLAGFGLAERREQTVVWGRERPVAFWRVSASGRTIPLLSWRAPDPSGTREPTPSAEP